MCGQLGLLASSFWKDRDKCFYKNVSKCTEGAPVISNTRTYLPVRSQGPSASLLWLKQGWIKLFFVVLRINTTRKWSSTKKAQLKCTQIYHKLLYEAIMNICFYLTFEGMALLSAMSMLTILTLSHSFCGNPCTCSER